MYPIMTMSMLHQYKNNKGDHRLKNIQHPLSEMPVARSVLNLRYFWIRGIFACTLRDILRLRLKSKHKLVCFLFKLYTA